MARVASSTECYNPEHGQQDLDRVGGEPPSKPLWWSNGGIDTSNRKNVIHDIPNLGFSGDQLLRPLFMDDEWRPYEGGVIFVDPSGAR